MSSDFIRSLRNAFDKKLKDISLGPSSFAGMIQSHYGTLRVLIEYDEEDGSLRLAIPLLPPTGAGTEFLLWCLCMNAQYWDVKFGMDDEGHLMVHSDFWFASDSDPVEAATEIQDRLDTAVDLIDQDYTSWLFARGLGTPAQRERWQKKHPSKA